MGLNVFGVSYLGLPGLRRTIVLKYFQGLYWRFSSSMAQYICVKLSTRRLAHLVNTIFGIPSGPGALYGLSLLSCFSICAFVIFLGASHCRGNFWLSCPGSCIGFVGKKLLASATLFSSLLEAILSASPVLYFNAGMRDLPPSEAGADISLWTVHMSGSSAFSSQSR
jgi:hypothetical protein